MAFRKNHMRVMTARMVGVAVAVGLAGCGGGGGSDGETVDAYPVQSVIATLFTSSNSVLSNTVIDPAGRDDYIFTTRYEPTGQTALFEGSLRQTVVMTTTITRAGAPLGSSSSTLYYGTSPLVWYGQVSDSGRYSVHENITALPATARIGASGTWFTAKDYASAAKTVLEQTTRVDWNVTSASDTAVWICLDYVVTPTGSTDARSGSTCLLSDAKGNILASRADRVQAR